MEHLVELLVPLACGFVLPIMVIYLGVRQKMNETNNVADIMNMHHRTVSRFGQF